MHLSGQADARNLIGAQFALCERFAYGDAAGPPPIARILLRSANLWGCKGRVVLGGGGDNTSIGIDHERACTSSPHVDSEKIHFHLIVSLSAK